MSSANVLSDNSPHPLQPLPCTPHPPKNSNTGYIYIYTHTQREIQGSLWLLCTYIYIRYNKVQACFALETFTPNFRPWGLCQGPVSLTDSCNIHIYNTRTNSQTNKRLHRLTNSQTGLVRIVHKTTSPLAVHKPHFLSFLPPCRKHAARDASSGHEHLTELGPRVVDGDAVRTRGGAGFYGAVERNHRDVVLAVTRSVPGSGSFVGLDHLWTEKMKRKFGTSRDHLWTQENIMWISLLLSLFSGDHLRIEKQQHANLYVSLCHLIAITYGLRKSCESLSVCLCLSVSVSIRHLIATTFGQRKSCESLSFLRRPPFDRDSWRTKTVHTVTAA